MAKKKKTTVEVETPQVETEVKLHPEDRYKIEEPKVENPPKAREILDNLKTKHKEDSNKWEIKDRVFYLREGKKPISHAIRTCDIFWFDKEMGYERELKYCQNQTTCFVDEMKGDQRLEHIIFRNGALFVPKEKVTLQKFLDVHPHNGSLFYEYKPTKVAATQLDQLVLEVNALTKARSIDVNLAEAILRVEVGSRVSEMSSKELKRDLLLFAKHNPALFLELADDDNVQLRNFGIKAVEAGIIQLTHDQRYFVWGSNKRKVMTIPFDEHPYSALAAWFKTDEGMEIYSNIEKRLNL